MKKDIQILVIPDVHGRTFWREAVAAYPDAVTVFLGDYLDQYDGEGISDEQVMEVFKDILSLKEARPETVHLLLGNHDLAFLDPVFGCGRHKALDDCIYRPILRDEFDKFEMAFDAFVGNERFLFSHAGVTMGWMSLHHDLFDGMPLCGDLFTLMLRSQDIRPYLMDALCDVSHYRFGQQMYGSMVWADVREMMFSMVPCGFQQVFGHTQQDVEPAFLMNRAFCLDCRRPFYIDGAGRVRDYADDSILGERKYIFLDVEGVLYGSRTGRGLSGDCLAVLGDILDLTDARIVITSSWRGRDVAETVRFLTDTSDPRVGANPFPFSDKVVGITRHRTDCDFVGRRGVEIGEWLKMHSCTSYAIIGDWQGIIPGQRRHIVHPSEETGLDIAAAEEVLEMLA